MECGAGAPARETHGRTKKKSLITEMRLFDPNEIYIARCASGADECVRPYTCQILTR